MSSLAAPTHDRGITTLTLDSPANRNALSARLVGELSTALDACAADDTVRAVVLTHTGNTFCAGADLTGPPDPAAFVALITGHVRAGGLGLLGACDISAAGPDASFALTESRLGLAPAVISLPLLPRTDPRAAARYYLTGERFDATEAARISLITIAVGSAEDIDKALVPVLDGLRKASPQGLAASKELVTATVLKNFDQHAEDLIARSAALFASAEAREGMTAFLERRDPAWLL
ncbi:enoyl-CoA hydratase-related protein [Streptomyces atratus]|uniref:enoyl-CoA hydratase-related protein n=1 Tax=Streptomyces atratus TaxID=1893 RepID=UPI00224E2A3B|nr:enoyl-CoA hydratase-related protein [Streptomyces atratus]MCX5341737.1 enoyl-CoA hydratase-related protein [Streptomyces atratus]